MHGTGRFARTGPFLLGAVHCLNCALLWHVTIERMVLMPGNLSGRKEPAPEPLHDPISPPEKDPPDRPLQDPTGDPTFEPSQPVTEPTPNPAIDPPPEMPTSVLRLADGRLSPPIWAAGFRPNLAALNRTRACLLSRVLLTSRSGPNSNRSIAPMGVGNRLICW
jgi:hypothetical protein